MVIYGNVELRCFAGESDTHVQVAGAYVMGFCDAWCTMQRILSCEGLFSWHVGAHFAPVRPLYQAVV